MWGGELKLTLGDSLPAPQLHVSSFHSCPWLTRRHVVKLLHERFSDQLDIVVVDVAVRPDPSLPDVTYITADLLVRAQPWWKPG